MITATTLKGERRTERMHQAIFSDHEVQMIKEFLETGEKPEGFRLLMHRIRQYNLTIMEHFHLMMELLNSDNVRKEVS